jgi:hypothetical protein
VLYDFYTQNGFEIEEFCGMDRKQKQFALDPVKRQDYPPDFNILVVAKRLKADPMHIPLQTKYMQNPGLA